MVHHNSLISDHWLSVFVQTDRQTYKCTNKKNKYLILLSPAGMQIQIILILRLSLHLQILTAEHSAERRRWTLALQQFRRPIHENCGNVVPTVSAAGRHCRDPSHCISAARRRSCCCPSAAELAELHPSFAVIHKVVHETM